MSTVIEEVVTLEDIDLDKTPPCQLRHGYAGDAYDKMSLCGKPSVHRVILHFQCGDKFVRFVCGECYEDAVIGRMIGCKTHSCEHDLTYWSLT
jgi:hypothetical protein